MARMKFLCDAERCIECNGCVTACKNEHEVPWGVNRRRVVVLDDGVAGEKSISVACMHCTDAPCAAVCPVDCFYTTDDGIVLQLVQIGRKRARAVVLGRVGEARLAIRKRTLDEQQIQPRQRVQRRGGAQARYVKQPDGRLTVADRQEFSGRIENQITGGCQRQNDGVVFRVGLPDHQGLVRVAAPGYPRANCHVGDDAPIGAECHVTDRHFMPAR